MNIVGLSAFYHESACCLLQEGRLVAAAAEERFTRIKHDPRLPVRAFRYCLEAGGLSIADVDCIAYYEAPVEKLARQLWAGPPRGDSELAWLDPGRPLRAIRERLGYDGPVAIFRHHESHAASAFFYSGFDEAAILTVDGVGEWATTTYGHGRAGAPPTLELLEEVHFPHSLGLLYATITAYLGFRVNSGEYKVMGLAAHGRPRYVAEVERLLEDGPGGQFRLDMRYFDFLQGQAMYAPALCALFGRPPRRPDEPLEPFHRDVACSVQAVLEAMLLRKVRYLAARVPSANLCMAGGVALNCVANGRLLREGPFARLFVQPAAGDAGGCLGAAALAHTRLAGGRPPIPALRHVYLGPAPAPGEIAALVAATGLPALDFRGREGALLEAVADRLAAGKVVGWFQGRMEFGPRALGARSILASPLEPEMQERLNAMVKKRERFRPFAPSVLLAHAAEHFALDHPSPFMLETCAVTSPLPLPAVTHVDGSARPQTVEAGDNARFAALLESFYARTGCPVLLNTSFNVAGEPIVCTPVDALYCMTEAGLDALALGDFLIDRRALPAHWENLLPAAERRPAAGPLPEGLYTFV